METAPAQRLPDASMHDRIMEGIDLTLKERYFDARRSFETVVRNWPSHPSGYLFLAAVMQAECSDYDTWLNRPLYDSLLEKAALRAEQMMSRQKGDPWGYYYAGTASAYRSFSESEEGNWYTALKEGISSAGMFEEALNCDASFWHAMSGLGTYYYWRSRKTDFLNWLPFMKDKRSEGFSMLRNAAQNSVYESAVAVSSMMWILIEECRYREAVEWADRILSRYPDNRSVLWGILTAHERIKDSTSLKKDVVRLLASIVAAPVRNIYAEITCRLKLAQFAAATGDARTGEEECAAILRYQPMSGKTHKDISKKLEAARELSVRLRKSK
jgi:tetratricopeptide (TPR) repeat protein